MSQTGYLYIWVSNESENTEVWFDDLNVIHQKTLVAEATDYGVWGDVMREQKWEDLEGKYRWGYQGDFSEHDEETGWDHFEAREYDPTIGRWLIADKERQFSSPYLAMANNPIIAVDPDGKNVPILIGWLVRRAVMADVKKFATSFAINFLFETSKNFIILNTDGKYDLGGLKTAITKVDILDVAVTSAKDVLDFNIGKNLKNTSR